MTQLTLALHTQPALPVDLRGFDWAAAARLGEAELSRRPLWLGRETVPLGEIFTVTRCTGDVTRWVVDGDASRIDGLGCAWREGELRITGAAGDYLGAGMSGGRIVCEGAAGHFTACEMAGGRLEVQGDVGDFAAGARPGAMDGMRGGQLVIHGHAGQRLADRMRRGTVWVHGGAGDFAASRLVAGTVAIAGAVGAHPAWGMRRGTLVLCRAQPALGAGFAATQHDFATAWGLIRRSLAQAGGAFAGLADDARLPRRHAGDAGVDGRGEVLMPQG
jgi:formylmethanofuran dehydrogenase subunit C